MIRKILAALLALFAAAAFAATDVNTATQAELESVKGIGPSISTKILDARKSGPFKDWGDLVTRVKGVGDKNSAEFSAAGLTVNGAAKSGAPADPSAVRKNEKSTTKTAAKGVTPAATVTPTTAPAAITPAPTTAAVAPAATASAPMSAADKKAAAKEERDAKKAAKADEKARKKAAKADSAASGASRFGEKIGGR